MKTKWVAWTFNNAEWGIACKEAVSSLGMQDLAKMMDVSVSTISRWCRGETHEDARPSMKNFVMMCNLLDENPARFFGTEE